MSKRALIRGRDLMKLLLWQQKRCAYSGRALTPDDVTGDHVVSVDRGGSHGIENIRLVTEDINRMKGTLSLQELVDYCRDVVRIFGMEGPVVLPPYEPNPVPRGLFREPEADAPEDV